MKNTLSLLSLIMLSLLFLSTFVKTSHVDGAMAKKTALPCTKMMTQVQANTLIVSWKSNVMPFMTQ
ncbi:MAG: hypothetical protein VSS75_019500 [Candidatus Parabeggiatoa sp.]|nr:hypothetical protein [Candidatus Parabeggiatoa sp.]